MSSLLIVACAGFLLAVLWMDLMFDVQVLPYRSDPELPEPVLASIAGYYRRVTIEAWPMNRLIATVMLVALLTLLIATVRSSFWLGVVSLVLCGGPIVLVPRIVANAMRLGGRTDSTAEQSRLARAICRGHLICLAGIVSFLLLRLAAGA